MTTKKAAGTLTATAIPAPLELPLFAVPSASTVDLFFDWARTFCSPLVMIVIPALWMCASVSLSR